MELDRKQLERKYVEQIALSTLSEDDYERWKTHTVAHRLSVHRGAIFLLWQMGANNAPLLIDSFTVQNISIGWKQGLAIELLSSRLVKMNWTISQAPSLLADRIFVWVPYFPDIRYEPHPHGEGWLLRASMCTRTDSHPNNPVTGGNYFMPVGEFRGRFPTFASTQF